MEEFEKVVVLDSEVQAQLVSSMLTQRGIPHNLRSYHDLAYDGVFQAQRGWGHIEAPREFHAEILAVVRDSELQPHATGMDGSSTVRVTGGDSQPSAPVEDDPAK